MPIQVADIQNDPTVTLDVIVRVGFRALLYVPLLGTEKIVGALVVRRKQPGEFATSTIELLQTFAAQSVLAIQNARLFSEVREKSLALAVASSNKSQFVSSMSQGRPSRSVTARRIRHVQAVHGVRERLVSQCTGIINQIRALLLERGRFR